MIILCHSWPWCSNRFIYVSFELNFAYSWIVNGICIFSWRQNWLQVVTKQTKKGESSSTSESMEVEEEEIFGVVQSVWFVSHLNNESPLSFQTTPPPYFVTLLTDRSRDEFYRIAKNPFLTKAELLYTIRRWASKQPKLVRVRTHSFFVHFVYLLLYFPHTKIVVVQEAIFDIEHELIRQQASVRKEAGAILEALPLAFLQ